MTPKKNLDSIPPIVFVVITLAIMVFGAHAAHAASAASAAHAASDGPELAFMPTPKPIAPLTLAGRCDDGVAVFSVMNNAAPWATPGAFGVIDAVTGRVLRERRLALGERQTASFRLPADASDSGRYRLTVRMTGERMTYVKSFFGHCVASN